MNFLLINCKRGIFKFFLQFFSKIFFQIFSNFRFSKIWKFSVLHLKTIIQKNERLYKTFFKYLFNISRVIHPKS